MKKTRKLMYVVLATLTFTFGCSEDFLEPERNTASLTDADFADNAAINPGLIEGTLTGIYTYMSAPFGTLGTTASRHYDIGQKGVDIFSDMVCGDMALTNNAYNWYANTTNLVVTVDFTLQENQLLWNYYYKLINSANVVIGNVGGNDAEPEDAAVRATLGQAKTLRAQAYYNLALYFQRSYNPSEEILPLYDGVQSLTTKQPASDIYALIIDDLTHAVDLLEGYDRGTDKFRANQSVAEGLLAYTYGAMGDYPNAKIYAERVITNGGYTLTTTGQLAFPGAGSGFNDLNNAAWMWGFDLTEDLGYGLVSWWGQVDYFSYSYAAAGDRKGIDQLLYDAIPSNDIRKDQFSTAAATALMPLNKFFDQNRVPFEQNPMDTDYVYMRVEEFYLLSAEASAQTGDEASAKARLIDLLTNRMGGLANATAYVQPLTGTALKNAIYLQTRIELWGEGKSYAAMKRNKATVTRGSNHTFLAGSSIAYDDDRISFQIPQSEMNNNPGITEQN